MRALSFGCFIVFGALEILSALSILSTLVSAVRALLLAIAQPLIWDAGWCARGTLQVFCAYESDNSQQLTCHSPSLHLVSPQPAGSSLLSSQSGCPSQYQDRGRHVPEDAQRNCEERSQLKSALKDETEECTVPIRLEMRVELTKCFVTTVSTVLMSIALLRLWNALCARGAALERAFYALLHAKYRPKLTWRTLNRRATLWVFVGAIVTVRIAIAHPRARDAAVVGAFELANGAGSIHA